MPGAQPAIFKAALLESMRGRLIAAPVIAALLLGLFALSFSNFTKIASRRLIRT
jgi:hypothetical protein